MSILKAYKKIIAGDFLCVPACLEVILQRYNFSISQYVIAEYLGLYVPIDYCGPVRNVRRTNNRIEWGVQLQLESLNKFFIDFSFPLQEKYIHHKQMDEVLFDEIITNNSNRIDTDVICGFDYGILNNFEYGSGHVSLVLGLENDCIFTFDPGPKDPGIKKYLTYEMYLSMKKKNDGLWIIKMNNYV